MPLLEHCSVFISVPEVLSASCRLLLLSYGRKGGKGGLQMDLALMAMAGEAIRLGIRVGVKNSNFCFHAWDS